MQMFVGLSGYRSDLQTFYECHTLVSQISVHVRLIYFGQTSTLYALISGLQAYLFFWISKDFCQIFRPNLEKFWEKLSKFLRVFLIMNKIASFYPAL